MNSFAIRTVLRLRVERSRMRGIWLSCPKVRLRVKPLIQPGHHLDGRFDPREHLRRLRAAGRIGSETSPILLCGIRNVLSNFRCIAATPGSGSRHRLVIHAVHGEQPRKSKRPYYALSLQGDRDLRLDEFYPATDSLNQMQWLFSGVPVLWDDLSQKALFRRIQVEAADQSHVYRLLRGDNPRATDESREAFESMHDAAQTQRHASVTTAFNRLHALAERLGLRRETSYLHHVMGVDESGNLVLVIGHGKLEELGRLARVELGARRAICVENGGSVTLLYYPQGLGGPEISLVAGPNQRRSGTAFLAIELEAASFGTLPASQSSRQTG